MFEDLSKHDLEHRLRLACSKLGIAYEVTIATEVAREMLRQAAEDAANEIGWTLKARAAVERTSGRGDVAAALDAAVVYACRNRVAEAAGTDQYVTMHESEFLRAASGAIGAAYTSVEDAAARLRLKSVRRMDQRLGLLGSVFRNTEIVHVVAPKGEEASSTINPLQYIESSKEAVAMIERMADAQLEEAQRESVARAYEQLPSGCSMHDFYESAKEFVDTQFARAWAKAAGLTGT